VSAIKHTKAITELDISCKDIISSFKDFAHTNGILVADITDNGMKTIFSHLNQTEIVQFSLGGICLISIDHPQ
jgi:hypothetical protein